MKRGAVALAAVMAASSLAGCRLGSTAAAAANGILVVRAGAGCSDRPSSGTQPHCTINGALRRVQPGQAVIVREGTYREEVSPQRSGRPGAPILISAALGEQVAITGVRSGFRIVSLSYVIVQGFAIAKTASTGVHVSASDHITIAGNTVQRSGSGDPNAPAPGIGVFSSRDVVVVGNHAFDNNNSGVFLSPSVSRSVVHRNVVDRNGKGLTEAGVGIDVRGDGNLIVANRARGNEDSGFQFHDGAVGNVAANNVAWENGDHGIDVANSTAQRIIGNTVTRNATAGINIEGESRDTLIQNNVVFDNAPTERRAAGNIRVTGKAEPGTVADYNLVHQSGPGALYVWASKGQGSLGPIQALGQEQHGIEAPPALGADLRPGDGSPAIDRALDSAIGSQPTDAEGRPRHGAPDLGALEASAAPAPPALVLTMPQGDGVLVWWRAKPGAVRVLLGSRVLRETGAGATRAVVNVARSELGRVSVVSVRDGKESVARRSSTAFAG